MTVSFSQSIPVYAAESLRVRFGANLGDGLSFADDVELNDIYELTKLAPRTRLAFASGPKGQFLIADDTQCGTPGAQLFLDSAMMFMAPNGTTVEVLVLVETGDGGHVEEIFFHALAPVQDETEYTLVGIDVSGARQKFAQVACVSFTRGTHITLASGEQIPIEALNPGDRVLTRDDGAQQIRWIGQSTVRATGAFAPILIKSGVLNNENDLLVSPDHRLFVYQRTDRMGVGRPDLLIKARHLVNGETVVVQEGGYIDYFQLLFDRHHIIYAEGIAAESMLIDNRTRSALPSELLDKLTALVPGHAEAAAHGMDVQKTLLDRPDAIDILRRASLR